MFNIFIKHKRQTKSPSILKFNSYSASSINSWDNSSLVIHVIQHANVKFNNVHNVESHFMSNQINVKPHQPVTVNITNEKLFYYYTYSNNVTKNIQDIFI